MGLMFQPLQKYFQFSGRARRSEYWLFFLFVIVLSTILGFVDGIVGTFDEITGYGLFSGIFILLILIPNISVGVRRLHDTDRSGWWLLLGIIPLVGLVLLVFFCLNGTTGENRFGPDPKADVNEINF